MNANECRCPMTIDKCVLFCFLTCADDYTDEMCFMIGVDFYSRILDWPFDYNGPLPWDVGDVWRFKACDANCVPRKKGQWEANE